MLNGRHQCAWWKRALGSHHLLQIIVVALPLGLWLVIQQFSVAATAVGILITLAGFLIGLSCLLFFLVFSR